jgi:hypothetical protein
MPDKHQEPDLVELRALLEENQKSIESLRSMIENMEILLATVEKAANAKRTRFEKERAS